MNGLEAELGAEVQFVRFNADTVDGKSAQSALTLRGHPSLALLDARGVVVVRYVGTVSAETLRAALLPLIPPE